MNGGRNASRILAELGRTWTSSEDLFDRIAAPRDKATRSSYGHSLRRLVARGVVLRDDSSWPYRYRLAPEAS